MSVSVTVEIASISLLICMLTLQIFSHHAGCFLSRSFCWDLWGLVGLARIV